MKNLQLKLRFLLTTTLILICLCLNAQVKTKIFKDGIPQQMVPTSKGITREIFLKPPQDFNELKNKSGKDLGNRFATSLPVNIKFNEQAEIVEVNDYRIRTLRITAKEALNISLEFGKFNLSQNALLSIYTNNELTGSITSKENNENNVWATRVYQGNSLNIVLKEPKENNSVLEISKVSFGYKKYGIQYGNPGASADCEINVNCTLGNGWDAEKNSVALIVANGSIACTGSLVMNTCGTNIPYLLTANHCLGAGNVNNWVFQFQYWSTTCFSNSGWIEDVQFNGCNLKANSSATDFALLQLNQTPPANSGISYAGWSRNTTGITQTTIIHLPAGDLMKITRDINAPTNASFLGASCWHLEVDAGTTEGGSSGAPYFDQNHRIIGQHYGIDDANLPICDQVSKFGGRFDLSWAGGGTNATRLSNWLDPSGSNAMTTNTTDVSNLTPAPYPNILSISLSPVFGEDCQSVEVNANVPSNTPLTWTTTGGLLINGNASPQTITGNSVTITSPNGDGYVTATFNNCVSDNFFFCPCGDWPGNPQITWIWSSPAQGEPLEAYVSPAHPWADRYIWMVDGQVIQDGPDTDLLAYDYPCTWEKDLYVIAVYGCGSSAPVYGGPYSPLCSGSRSVNNVVVYPNPASSQLLVKLKEPGLTKEKENVKQGNLSQILSVTLYDKIGRQRKTIQFDKGSRQVSFNVSEISSDVYYLEVSDGILSSRIPVIIKH